MVENLLIPMKISVPTVRYDVWKEKVPIAQEISDMLDFGLKPSQVIPMTSKINLDHTG